MHYVLINGPAGAGKNTLALRLKTELQSRINNSLSVRALLKRPVSSIAIEEFKQPLINMLFAFAESLSVIELGAEQTPALYERLKNTMMLGRLGRDWQIIIANAMRAADSSVFVDGLHAKARAMDPDIIIVPDCGFPDEYQRTVNRYGSDSVTMIYLDGWKANVPIYSHYDRFEDDIRICLRDWASLQNPDHVMAASYIIGRMEERAAQKTLDF